MSGIPFIYNVPKEFLFSTFNKSFGFSGESDGVFMNSICTEHPYFTTFLYTCHTSSPAVRHFEPNCVSIESSKRKIKKWVMAMTFKHFSIIIFTKIRSYINSSFHCNRVDILRHVDNIVVSNLLPSSSNE